MDRIIPYGDQTRTVQSTTVTVSAVESHTTSFNSRHSHTQSPTTLNAGKPVVRFYCTKQRHIQKRYLLRLAQLHTEERRAPTAKPQQVPRAGRLLVSCPDSRRG